MEVSPEGFVTRTLTSDALTGLKQEQLDLLLNTACDAPGPAFASPVCTVGSSGSGRALRSAPSMSGGMGLMDLEGVDRECGKGGEIRGRCFVYTLLYPCMCRV